MARLPVPGGDGNDWGTVLNDYLQQALASDGTLVSGSTNSYTGSSNTNLASTSKAGLVQLAGDLSNTAASPTVVGLQGNAVAAGTPSNGYVLTWNTTSSQWSAQSPSAAASSFETVSKNLSAYPFTLNYTSGVLTSLVYTVGSNTITKTLNYTSGVLTSIVLSGSGLPGGITHTKTLNYTSGTLTSISYS